MKFVIVGAKNHIKKSVKITIYVNKCDEVDGKNINVDIGRLGRITYVAQSFDLKHAWVWDNNTKEWKELGEEYLKPVKEVIRMARKQATLELVKLPIFGAE